MIFGWIIIAFGIIGFVGNLTKHPEKVGNLIVALLFLLIIVGGCVMAFVNWLKNYKRYEKVSYFLDWFNHGFLSFRSKTQSKGRENGKSYPYNAYDG